MSFEKSIGYGPRFDGNPDNYEQWEVRYLGLMAIKSCKSTVLHSDESTQPDATKNETAFSYLVQLLDPTSLSLVMNDAKDNGMKALQILRDHYCGKGKPRILTLYTQLCNLRKSDTETITEYILRAEKAFNGLKSAGETISDSLIIAMLLKGLPESYKSFVVVTTQSEKTMSFTEFKVALKSYSDNEDMYKPDSCDSVLKVDKTMQCFRCGDFGHKSPTCPAFGRSKKLFCNFCKKPGHVELVCRKKKKSKSSESDAGAKAAVDHDEKHSFMFRASETESKCTVVNKIMVDCGATSHIVTKKHLLSNVDNQFDPLSHKIELADGTKSSVVKLKGDASVSLMDENDIVRKTSLQKALYIPSFPHDIFSVQSAVNSGATITFRPDSADMITADGQKFDIVKDSNLYYLKQPDDTAYKCHSLESWHKIYGHCNQDDILKTEQIVSGMKISNKSKFACDICIQGKQARNDISKVADPRATKPLELVHTDICGPLGPTSYDGFKYTICFVDDYSGMTFHYFLKAKADASKAMAKFIADVSKYGDIKCIRSDNGGEYTSVEFKDLLIANKINHQTSAPNSPHQNGTAERQWRTSFDMARCMLLDSGMPKFLWTYAIATADHIRNRCHQVRTGKTAYELFTGKMPNVSHMHEFGTKCFLYVEANARTKLSPRGRKVSFVGYDRYSPALLVYDAESKRVTRSRNVKFPNPDLRDVSSENGQIDLAEPTDENVCNNTEGTHSDDNGDATKCDNNPNIQQSDNASHNREKRETRPPAYLDDYYVDTINGNTSSDSANCSIGIDYCYRVAIDTPRSYDEAVSSTSAEQWRKAMDDEVNALNENNTWTLRKLPPGREPVGGKWVYTKKLDENGNIERYKARYVAQGFKQVKGFDFNETFSPTPAPTAIRAVVHAAAQNNWIIHHMDVKTAFLNAKIDHDIFVVQPKGYEVYDPDGTKLFCNLNKSIYGLKQSGRMWNHSLHDFLCSLNFVRSELEYCLYSKVIGKIVLKILVFVDDILIISNDMQAIENVKHNLKEKYKMSDLGLLKWFLGINFSIVDNVITMSQSQYLYKLLEKYGMENSKPVSTPCEKIDFAENDDDNLSHISLDEYRSVVGSLVYATICTRPDLSWILSKLSQYLHVPVTNQRWAAVKRVLRYIKGTLDYKLQFKRADGNLCGYSDADWGGSTDRRSTSGYCFKFADSSVISWKTRKQPTIALSTCEAEYMALASATQEALYLIKLMQEIDEAFEQKNIEIFDDSQSAIALAHNPVSHGRTKHIDIKFHFIRHHVNVGNIVLKYVPTSLMLADVFTKGVEKQKLAWACTLLFGK